MDKYAVEVDKTTTKTAGTSRTCPGCGGPLKTDNANVPHCPRCGTQPFEKKRETPRK